MKKLIITLLSALCIPIFAETNAPIVLTEELVPYALNTNVVHASQDGGCYYIDGLMYLSSNGSSITLSPEELIQLDNSNGSLGLAPVNAGDSSTSFLSVRDGDYFAPVGSGFLALTSNTNGVPDIDLSNYALNTNVVHASYDSSNGYNIKDSVTIDSSIFKVTDGDSGYIVLTADDGLIFDRENGSMTIYNPDIIGTVGGEFLFGKDYNDNEYSLYMPSDSNGKYLALTTNNTGHINYDEIVGTPDIDISNLVLKSDIYNTIPLSTENESRGVNFIDSDGDIDQNVAITIGKDAVAGLSDTTPDTVPDNTTLRSTGIAIGAYAKANGTTSNGRRNQGIAIGFNADASGMSSVAIGSGSVHGSETSLTGSNAYSLGEGSVSLGYNSKSLDQWSVALGSYSYASNYWSIALGYLATASATSSVALGPTAKANARGAVQIGNGTNTEEFSLKFRDTTIVRDGKIVGTDVISNTNSSGVVLGYYLEGNSDKIFQPKGNYITTNYIGDVSIKGRFAGGQSTAKGDLSHSEGLNTTANGYASHSEGRQTVTGSSAGYSHAEGNYTQANGGYSHSDGTYSKATHILSWVWQGGTSGNTAMDYYESKGPGTFNINPVGGTDGFYIGETNLTDHIKNISTSVIPPKISKQVAMFIIPVNNDLTWNIFTDFELKASTNNFNNAYSEDTKLQYYAQSEIANIGSSTETVIDKMWLFTETSNISGDFRKYKYIQNTINYTNILNSVVVLVDTSCLKRHNENNGEWLSEGNEEIIWCYCRYNSTAGDKTPEYEYGTNNQLWRPIAPVKWFSKMPSWASSQIQ